MNRKRLIQIIIVTPTIILLGICIQFGWWYWHFNERLRLADEHSPIVRQALQADGRFQVVTVESFTGNNGSILIHVLVPKGTTAQLEAIVAKTLPPVPITYDIKEVDASTQPTQ